MVGLGRVIWAGLVLSLPINVHFTGGRVVVVAGAVAVDALEVFWLRAVLDRVPGAAAANTSVRGAGSMPRVMAITTEFDRFFGLEFLDFEGYVVVGEGAPVEES